MERTEPTFVPEWLKSSGGLSTSHQSSSLHPDEQGASKSVKNKSIDNDRTTSSYFRRSSISNGSALSRSYSSFGRNNRDREWDRDNNNRHKDYSDPLSNILPSRFEKEGLRRSFSSVSGKRGESSFPRKVVSDISIANKSIKTSFERDFPSLGTDEKQVDNNNNDIGRVPSPGLSSAIQSLPIGNAAVIGGDGWTSALAEVPVIVGSNGGTTSSVSVITNMTGGRNMAETLAHGPPRTQTAPQLNVGTQRLEELAVKQSRQLIPMTPSMPKALALNSDKPKLKVNQPHPVNHPHSPRPVSIKPDVSKTSKLLVLKPSRERNGISPTPKDPSTLSPTSTTKLPNSPLAIPLVEKKPSLQAQSRSNFFNLMRKKSMTNNNSSSVAASSGEKTGEQPPPEGGGDSESTMVKQSTNGDATVGSTDNGKNHDVILYSEEEEARFLRSLGWDETAEEEEGLTEEEINSFYRNYLSLKPASKFLKGTEAKLMMGSDSKVDA
ncbi:hypothetical protein L2E82_24821 [Cichorium intybus]|uniref:Uncharacterized protein n=1 Tax=Cichorium intybus TaxID=13427 RepID=A0ACB9E1A8_CICIN|nr:hypothetical protein L2E82_24821 [Cichorium intybus]